MLTSVQNIHLQEQLFTPSQLNTLSQLARRRLL